MGARIATAAASGRVGGHCRSPEPIVRGATRRRRPPSSAPIGFARRTAAALILLVGLLLVVDGRADAHTSQGTATPGNNGPHPWPSDGCSTPGAKINTVPGVFDFTHACIHHDGCYTGFPRDGRPAYWVSRLQCDSWFLGDLQASCRWQHGTDLNATWAGRQCATWASVYHRAVRTFGTGYIGPQNN